MEGGELMQRITKIEGTPGLKKKIRVAAYARVSTDSEEQLVSLATQKDHYETYIKKNPEWEYAGLYYDEGITGTKKEKRKSLLRMLADCESGKIDLVITKSISRLARNTTDCLEIVRKLLGLGIYIYFEKEDLNTGSMESELMLTILSSLAESESVSISENEKWSIQRRFKNGSFVIGYPPYGYRNEDGKMVIAEEEAEIVKEIFSASLSGTGTYKIAKGLNAKGVKTKRNGCWTSSTVKGILTNEKYTGDVIFQKTYTDSSFTRHVNYGEYDQYLVKDHHEAIISHEDFDRTAQVLAQRGKEKSNTGETGKYQKRYAFSGKIRCGSCGSKFKRKKHYKSSGNYIAWACSTHLTDKNACEMMYIEQSEIEEAFITMMNKLIFSKKQLLKPFAEALSGTNGTVNIRRMQNLEQRLEKNKEQEEFLKKLLASGYLDTELISRIRNEIQSEYDYLKNEKTALSESISGSLVHAKEAKMLIRFIDKAGVLTEFDDSVFNDYVNEIRVLSRDELEFQLKCGLKIKERLVRK
jgi:DNA invertase Pin-like site-specific DNA recombinase